MNEIGNNNIKNLLDQLNIEETDEVVNEVNEEVFDSELYIILNQDNIMALVDDDGIDFLIPVFSTYDCVKQVLDDLNDDCLEIDIASGEDLLSLFFEDDSFMGLAINPPEYDYVLLVEDVEVLA